MPQLLHLQNSSSIVDRIIAADGRMPKLLKEQTNDDAVMDELFLTAFARTPSDRERLAVRKLLVAGERREEVFRDLFWALLNSKNFAFNH